MKKWVALFLSVMLFLSLTCCDKAVVWNGKTEELAALLMVEDVSDRSRYVGMVDYVFVGTVEEIIQTVLPNRSRKHEDNYSKYKIHVDQNIKGTLTEEIEASKMGGLKEDGTMYLVTVEMPTGIMIRDTGLPELGKQYIFLAYAQPDGSLTLSELFDNREYSEDLLKEYTDYYENEIVFERERFVSKYAESH